MGLTVLSIEATERGVNRSLVLELHKRRKQGPQSPCNAKNDRSVKYCAEVSKLDVVSTPELTWSLQICLSSLH